LEIIDNVENLPRIAEIKYRGNSVFTDKELRGLVERFIGQPATLASIGEIAHEIALYYQTAGYIGADARPVELQDLSTGTIEIEIVEGELEKIEIVGLKRILPAFIERYVRKKLGRVLNINEIDEVIRSLQLSPAIASVRGEIREGSSRSGSVLILEITENPDYRFDLSIDNFGAESSGDIQGSAGIRIRNLSRRTDDLFFQTYQTKGSQQYLVEYEFPLDFNDWNIRTHYEAVTSEVIVSPLDRFDIKGNYQRAFVEIEKSLFDSLEREIALSLQIGWQQNESFVLGRRFSFLPQSTNGVYELWTLRAGIQWTERRPTRAIVVRFETTFGWDSLEATLDNPVIFRTAANWVERIDKGLFFSFLFASQFSTASTLAPSFGVLPSEQFSLGGWYSVPGYDLNLRRGDNGVSARASLDATVIDSESAGRLSFVPFAAIGHVWNGNDVPIPSPATLASLGASFQWRWKGLQMLVGGAIPLSNTSVENERKLYFFVGYRGSF
jgi:hemolysin activation/secretion protein